MFKRIRKVVDKVQRNYRARILHKKLFKLEKVTEFNMTRYTHKCLKKSIRTFSCACLSLNARSKLSAKYENDGKSRGE